MKLAYVTIKHAEQLGKATEWSGTGYYVAEALKHQGESLDYLGPLEDKVFPHAARKLKRHYYERFFQKRYLKDTDPSTLRSYANQVSKKLKQASYKAVLSATINPIAYLECKQPILFWADATFQNTAEFYPKYSNLCRESVAKGHEMERLAIENCRFAIYSSHWAAQTAIDFYKADPEKVKVVPFGSNLESNLTTEEIGRLVKSRSSTTCKLIFIGVDWIRKGGDKALKVAQALHESGIPTELKILGCQPPAELILPDFVQPLGYISKFTQSGQDKIAQLISDSHFLILPTLADCSPIVFCEANAFGVPCLTTDVGGIPTIVKSDSNGRLFDVQASTDEYRDYISDVFFDYARYKEMALASFDAYKTRLNWNTAGKSVKRLLAEALN